MRQLFPNIDFELNLHKFLPTASASNPNITLQREFFMFLWFFKVKLGQVNSKHQENVSTP